MEDKVPILSDVVLATTTANGHLTNIKVNIIDFIKDIEPLGYIKRINSNFAEKEQKDLDSD